MLVDATESYRKVAEQRRKVHKKLHFCESFFSALKTIATAINSEDALVFRQCNCAHAQMTLFVLSVLASVVPTTFTACIREPNFFQKLLASTEEPNLTSRQCPWKRAHVIRNFICVQAFDRTGNLVQSKSEVGLFTYTSSRLFNIG